MGQNGKVMNVISLFLIILFYGIIFFLKRDFNTYMYYSILVLLLISSISIVIYNSKKTNYSKTKMKNKLIIFSFALTVSLIIGAYYIFMR